VSTFRQLAAKSAILSPELLQLAATFINFFFVTVMLRTNQLERFDWFSFPP
jgi:hypothetical protein